MKHRTKIALTAALIACCPLSPAYADIYQYTDSSGVVHFTNVNGGGKNHKKVRSESSEKPQSSGSTRAARSTSAPVASKNMPSAYVDIINDACDRHGVDPSLVHAIVKVESDFNPYALSRKGAMGLMQLMPQTAFEMNVKDSFDPADNIYGGVKYLKYLLERYEGNISLALAAYNSGETAVKKWGTIPPFRETQNYVQRILRIYNGGSLSSSGSRFITRQTIYMGYGDDGSVIFTDNPTSHPTKKLKTKKKSL